MRPSRIAILFLFSWLPAHAAVATDLCRFVTTVVGKNAANGVRIVEALGTLELQDREGQAILLEVRLDDDLISIRPHDHRDHAVGYFEILVMQGGLNLILAEAHWEPSLQRQGLTQKILRCLYDHALSGARLSVKSDNIATNNLLTVTTRKILNSAEYRALEETSPHDADKYVQQALTADCQRQLEGDSPMTPAWYRALRKSGWDHVVVAPAGEDVGLFLFLARKG